MAEVLRYTAFSDDPHGGNPAGVVLDATGMSPEEMLATAAAVGYSETAFLVPRDDDGRTFDVRYFAPESEVAFCGHATVASGVALAERLGAGPLTFHTPAGEIAVDTAARDGRLWATLTSVEPQVVSAEDSLVDDVLAVLGWSRDDLDPSYPLSLANAGVWHLVLVARTRERLAQLSYDQPRLADLMRAADLTTLQLVWPDHYGTFQSRNPFPVGGVFEDPATGAAAAALGAYLAHHGLVAPDASFSIEQGVDMGRPSLIQVALSDDSPRVRVSGKAVAL
ncbi:PhzF family phenazine biosynthesis protein [Mumia zhuanghuii]|uniref:PhzF family phenazine biosynthesis protein n=1 Tax=Mumia zhuanghuii TaxID=2585211 RepID=A0A5C4MTH8_9ACTN|nr:PhzF family phenazine biosynthesis isomerase [Mumia zhuanghuii]TNC43574.1 PhzF family phenazine biosynthesis protein [Mumia zhuanghuii]TNC48645.1 PhzF family phenazine biosynthesis protein [Mumia zhuanghuii]